MEPYLHLTAIFCGLGGKEAFVDVTHHAIPIDQNRCRHILDMLGRRDFTLRVVNNGKIAALPQLNGHKANA